LDFRKTEGKREREEGRRGEKDRKWQGKGDGVKRMEEGKGGVGGRS